jgi:hypothetical protein
MRSLDSAWRSSSQLMVTESGGAAFASLPASLNPTEPSPFCLQRENEFPHRPNASLHEANRSFVYALAVLEASFVCLRCRLEKPS